ncbi:hypothetical protein Tco_1137901, partial [Tanacetum coccineum]
APPSPDYVLGPEHLLSPDYVFGPKEPEQAPLSPDYVPEPEYPEYLAPFDAEAPMEDQPFPDDASPTTLSPSYVADSDSDENPEEDPEEDPIDKGDNDDESSDDNDNDDEEEEEEHVASEDDDEEEEEHLAPTDSSSVPTINPVFQLRIQRHLRLTTTIKALIAEYAFAPTPPSPPPSPLSPLPSPLPQIPLPPLHLPSPPTTSPTYAKAPLGYIAAGIRLRVASPSTHHPSEIPSPPLLLPSTSHIDDLLEADMPLWKRARFTTLASGFEIPPLDILYLERLAMGLRVWDDMVGDMEERAPITIEGLSQRVTDLSTTLAQDTHEIYVRLEDTQDDRAL